MGRHSVSEDQRVAISLKNEMCRMDMGRDVRKGQLLTLEYREIVNKIFEDWEQELRQKRRNTEEHEIETTRQKLASLNTSPPDEFKPPTPPSSWWISES